MQSLPTPLARKCSNIKHIEQAESFMFKLFLKLNQSKHWITLMS